MGSNTDFLGLLMKDPVADKADTFNIEEMLNGNWRKVDENAAAVAAAIQNAIDARTKIVVGRYSGTGTHGKSNPNVLNFGFRPKIVIFNKGILNASSSSAGIKATPGLTAFFENNTAASFRNNNGSGIYAANCQKITVTDTGVSWYYEEGSITHDSKGTAAGQLNEDGTTYTYVAIG